MLHVKTVVFLSYTEAPDQNKTFLFSRVPNPIALQVLLRVPEWSVTDLSVGKRIRKLTQPTPVHRCGVAVGGGACRPPCRAMGFACAG